LSQPSKKMKKAHTENSQRDFVAIAIEYAEGVVSGAIVAGGIVKKACQRQLDDLAKDDWPYYFNSVTANRVCEFIECLPHTKGIWAQRHELLTLEPWQIFLVTTLFGWLRLDNDKRRYRSAYLEIPRKNGKSPLAAAIGLYMLLADGEFGAEVYAGATTEKQAWEVFRPAQLMLSRSPALRRALGADVCARALIKIKDASKFEPIIGNPGDGASPSCAIVDEFHEHDTPALVDTMETGMGAREQPLLLIITTAGYNIAGPCHEKNDELKKVLDGVIENEQLFGCIFSVDPEDDWANPTSLRKANPNYGVSVDGDFLLSQQRQAMANPVQQNRFKTKHLNVWCAALNGWMNMQTWALATDTMLDEDELLGEDCWIAIDLASKSDLCAEARVYRKMLNAKAHYYLFGRYWLPEAAIEEPGANHAHYVKWVKQGLLTQTDGATVDFDAITKQILEDCRRINPKEIVYDPFNATQMSQALMADGMKNVVEFQQRPWNFAIPMDEIEAALKDGRFHHDGNAITTWCFSNVVARPVKKGLFSPSKSKNHQKIDGAISTMMAIARAVAVDNTRVPAFQMIIG